MKNTDKLFRAELKERLAKYSEDPDPRIWQNIVAAAKSPRRKILPYWKKTGIASLAALALLSGWVGYDYQRSDAESAPDVEGKIIQKEQIDEGNIISNPREVNTASSQPSANDISVPQASARITPKTKTGVESTTAKELSGNSVILETADNANESSRREDLASINIQPLETTNHINESSGREDLASNNVPPLEIVNIPQSKPIDQGSVAKQKAVAKNSSDKKKKSRPYSIYFTAMPTMGYQRLKSNEQDKFIIASVDKIAAFSSDRLGLRAELGIELPVKNRINFFAGILYYQRKQTIGYTEKQVTGTNVSVDPDGNIVVLTEYEFVHKSFEHELKNLGVQVGFNYVISKTKFLQTVGTGIEFHYALNKLVQETPVVTNNPTAYVFYNLYYRLQYPSEGRLKAVAQPTLNYSFYIDENFNAPFYVKPYGLGFNIGATYNF